MTESVVLCDVDERGVATATLNRPESLNGMTGDMLRLLEDMFDRCDKDRNIRLLCLRGNGKHFSAGADVKGFGSGPKGESAHKAAPTLHDILRRLNNLRIPTLAAVQGACIGGGTALAACCDIVVASTDALFGIPEVRLGIPPLALLPYLLPVIGIRQVRRYALTGERFDATEAHRIGLVHQLCSRDQLMEGAAQITDALLRGEPTALYETKREIGRLRGSAENDDGEIAAEKRSAELMASPEVVEGVAAFREKRAPRWYPPGK